MPDNKNNTKPKFNAAAYKHAISMIESSGGKDLETGINPETGKRWSSAAGRYHFLYNLIKKAPEMKGLTKRQFMNNPKLQEQIMDLALEDKLEGFSYGPARADKLIKKYGSNMSTEQATALIHFIGIGGAEIAIKDPANFKVRGKNMTVDGYLNKFNVGLQRYKKHEDWMASNQTEVRVEGPNGDFTITKEGPVMGYDANGMAILRKDDTPPIAGDGTSYVSNYTPEQTAVREAVMDNEIQQAQVVQQQDRAQRAGKDAVVQPGDRNIDNQQTIKAIAPGGHDINNQKNLQGLQLTGEKRTNQRDPYARVQTNEFEGGGGLFDNMNLGFDGLDPGAGSAGAGAGAAPDAPGGPGVGAYVGAASTALELGQMAFGKNDMNTSGLVPPEDVPSKGSAALGGAMKGAASGAAFGPWGAAIGGVVGAGAGLLGNKKAATAAREADINYTGNIHNQETNDYAMGGSIQGAPTQVSHDASDLVTLFENGGSHQQNSLGGIPQGVGSNGKQNLVEEGETKWNDYIFSNKINTDGSSSEDCADCGDNKFEDGGELGALQKKINKRRLSKKEKASLIPRKLKNETMREFTIRKRRSNRTSPNTFAEGGPVDPPKKEEEKVEANPPSFFDKLKQTASHYSKPMNLARAAILGPIGEAGLQYIKGRVADNINPVGYGDNYGVNVNPGAAVRGPAGKLLNAIAEPQAGSRAWNDDSWATGSAPWLSERQDLMNMMMNDDLPSGVLSDDGKRGVGVSQYRPSNAVEGQTYYDSPATEASILADLKKNPELLEKFKAGKDGVRRYTGYGVNDTQSANEQGNVLGNYRMSIQADEDGREYLDYYDKWDIQPWKKSNPTLTKITDAAQKFAGVTAPEIYGRVYLDDNKKTSSDGYQHNSREFGGSLNDLAGLIPSKNVGTLKDLTALVKKKKKTKKK